MIKVVYFPNKLNFLPSCVKEEISLSPIIHNRIYTLPVKIYGYSPFRDNASEEAYRRIFTVYFSYFLLLFT